VNQVESSFNPTLGDTIAAVACVLSPSTRRVILRTSGPSAIAIAQRLSGRALSKGLCRVNLSIDHLPAIDVRLLVFASPASATGEDVVEYHLPGNTYLATCLLREIVSLGARQAEPGEFTARALFTGKIDLTRAEGVAAAISATHRQQLDASRQLMQGELSKRVLPLIDELAQTLALTEVGIDFTDEDVTFLEPAKAIGLARGVCEKLVELLEQSQHFEQLDREPVVVLVGRPNAGKSTLLNALAGYERAVVSATAGTTRDAIEATVRLGRGTVRVVDIAGLDEAMQADGVGGADIDQQMRQQATAAIVRADVIVMVVPTGELIPQLALPRPADLVVTSKSDLGNSTSTGVAVSARTGAGLDQLRARLDELCFASSASSQGDGSTHRLALNLRHRTELAMAIDALGRSLESIDSGAEFFAFDLREALDCLGRIVGTVSADDVLGKVFSSFCIGK